VTETPRPPLTTTTSIWPAASVLLLGIGMLAIFMILNISTDAPVTTTTTIPIVVGGLSTQTGSASGVALLSGCHQASEPPANIYNAFVLPSPTRANGPFALPNSGAGDFDCHRSFISTTTYPRLLGYYTNQLEARGWNEFSSGASNGDPQLLFQKAGSDTFYWVLGITINAHHGDTVDWTYRIYQNSSSI